MKTKELSKHIHTILQNYIKDIIIEVDTYCMSTGKKAKYTFYPAVAIGCEYGHYKSCGRSKKSEIKALVRKISLHPILFTALKKATNVEPEQVIKGYPPIFVGTCAEDHAANEILLKMGGKGRITSLNEIKFTKPRRPRTFEKRKMCQTCKLVFQ